MLGTKLGSSAGTVCALNSRALCPAPGGIQSVSLLWPVGSVVLGSELVLVLGSGEAFISGSHPNSSPVNSVLYGFWILLNSFLGFPLYPWT